jgi:hypothetical protein
MKQEEQYAILIANQITQMFDEESDNYIDQLDLEEGDNATHFTYALCVLAPTLIVKKFSDQIKDVLDLNQMANRLIFQYERKNNQEK